MFTYFSVPNLSVFISRLMLMGIVTVLPFVGGCGEDDNPIVDDDHDHEHEADAALHADADGFVLQVEEKEVYRQFQGTHSGGLTVGVGKEIEVHVAFLNTSGAEVALGEVEGADEHDHDEEEAFSLGLSGYDPAIIEIHLEHEEEHAEEEHEHGEEEHAEDEDEHEEHGEELGFGLAGLKAGKTEIKLQLLHGDHPDFTGALLIPVTVQ